MPITTHADLTAAEVRSDAIDHLENAELSLRLANDALLGRKAGRNLNGLIEAVMERIWNLKNDPEALEFTTRIMR